MAQTAEQAVIALTNRGGTDFQRVVCRILEQVLTDFQSIPDASGDGGLDGISDQFTVAYQCYGPAPTTRSKPTKQRREAYKKKFRHDLRRLYELGTKGRKLIHQENLQLASMFTTPAKIGSIRVCLNEFSDNALLGLAIKEQTLCVRHSQHRFVANPCSLLIWGPEKIAGLSPNLERAFAPKYVSPAPRPPAVNDMADFDEKYEYIAVRHDRARIDQLKSHLKDAWAKALGHELSLRKTSPRIHTEFLRIRTIAEGEALEMAPFCTDYRESYKMFSAVKEMLTSHFTQLLAPYNYPESSIVELASGEAARLVGACHVDWRPN